MTASLPQLLQQAQKAFAAGDITQAAAAFQTAATLAPADWSIHFNLGICLAQLGNGTQAYQAYTRAQELNPDHVPTLANLAATAFQLGQPDLALPWAQHQAALQPDEPLTQDNLGQIFQGLGEWGKATQAFHRALALAPGHAAILGHLGSAQQAQGLLEEAAATFRAALESAPGDGDILTKLGLLLEKQGRYEEGLALLQQALALAPQTPSRWSNVGNGLRRCGHYTESLAAHRQAVALAPEDASCHWNHGLALLGQGRWREGWAEYEWGERAGTRSRFSNRLPRWQGESLQGRSLLLRAEQGLGDTLQFLRFIPLLLARGGRIVVEVQPPLLPLLADPEAPLHWVPQGPDLPADAWGCDCYLPLMSLPHLLQLGEEHFTADANGPYIEVPPGYQEKWARLLPADGSLRIGLAWAGNSRHPNDRERSCPLIALAPLLELPQVQWVSLQKPPPPNLPASLLNLNLELEDFADTAAALTRLDLVITVDTAIAHLAGALGRPAWVMLAADADWRWPRQGRRSPWYGSLTLYRQKMPGQWLPLSQDITGDLRSWLDSQDRPFI
jgi:Flp pilus assembly protein TadD